MSGEACPATTLGITLHNRIIRKSAWVMVRGISVNRDGLGTIGNRSTITCAPRFSIGPVPNRKNEGRRPSHGATQDQAKEKEGQISEDGGKSNRNAPAMASPPWAITSVPRKSRARLRGSGGSMGVPR
jgi:hypothetical protein